MKTYKITIKKPQLVIEYDTNMPSPRDDNNLGYFITCDSKHISPDGDCGVMRDITEFTSEDAKDQQNHIDKITTELERADIEVVAIYPVAKYEHGGVCYKLGTQHGFDYSNNGFYIVTKPSQQLLGIKKKDFVKVIKQELELYNKWVNGDVFMFTLYDKYGKFIDDRSGYYNIEDIKECLPVEWQDEDLQEYFIDN